MNNIKTYKMNDSIERENESEFSDSENDIVVKKDIDYLLEYNSINMLSEMKILDEKNGTDLSNDWTVDDLKMVLSKRIQFRDIVELMFYGPRTILNESI